MDVGANKARGSPYADEALGSEDVSEAVTAQWAPRGFTYQVKSMFTALGTDEPPWKAHGRL